MDQRETTTSRLERQLFPRQDLAYWLGELLQAPVADIPTREDLEAELGMVGLPSEEAVARQTGQDVLDWIAQVGGLAGILRGSAAGRTQELMGKQRGMETFGKEMMDTSRRAQPQRWRQMLDEDLDPVERPMRSGYGRTLPPGETPAWRRGEMKPPDVVEKGTWQSPRMGEVEAYRIGAPVALPGGQQVQYLVVPSGTGGSVVLDTGAGQRQSIVFSAPSIGEALAKARQLQNRLALAAQDFPRMDWQTPRTVRFPWERGRAREPDPYGAPNPQWPWSYEGPPASGRWGE